MQKFVAELSSPVDKAAFEKSWQVDTLSSAKPKVEFSFDGRRVSAAIDSDSSNQWPSANFHQTFSAVIRRLDRACNIRWL